MHYINKGAEILEKGAHSKLSMAGGDSSAGEQMAGMRQAIILPLRSGKYALRVERPASGAGQSPLNFGLYYSENGQDDWWMKPVVKW